MFDLLSLPSLHETMVKVGSYVLSEFGYMIAQEDSSKSMQKQFDLIMRHFHNLNAPSRGMLLTAFMKMQKHDPSLRNQVISVFEQYKDYWDEDI